MPIGRLSPDYHRFSAVSSDLYLTARTRTLMAEGFGLVRVPRSGDRDGIFGKFGPGPGNPGDFRFPLS